MTALCITSCSLPETSQPKIDMKMTVDDIVRFGNNQETSFKFSITNNHIFSVIEFAETRVESKGFTRLGSCLEYDGTLEFKFNIQINSSSPLNKRIWWSIITEDGILYQDSNYVDSAQPNSRSVLELEDLPNIACSSFKPKVLAVRMEDNSFFYEYFYRIKSDKFKLSDLYTFPEGIEYEDLIVTNYKLAEETPYVVVGNYSFLNP
jgi:hypothetical protein